MRLAHLSFSLSRAAFGIFEVERSLTRELENLGVRNEAFCLLDERWNEGRRW